VATFEVATDRKHDGRQEQKTGTVTLQLEDASRNDRDEGTRPDHHNRLKRTDPVLLAVWKAAKQLEHLPESDEETETPPATVAACAASPAAPAPAA
jgi:hypothetical protein